MWLIKQKAGRLGAVVGSVICAIVVIGLAPNLNCQAGVITVTASSREFFRRVANWCPVGVAFSGLASGASPCHHFCDRPR